LLLILKPAPLVKEVWLEALLAEEVIDWVLEKLNATVPS